MGPTEPHPSGWTEERTDLLRDLIVRGLSASQIAAKLGGGVTRSGVVGKAFRLGLSVGGGIKGRKPGTEVRSLQNRINAGTFGGAKHRPQLYVVNEIGPTLRELKYNQCRWPLDMRLIECTASSAFCGATTIHGEPYCAEHKSRAWVSPPICLSLYIDTLKRYA